MYPLISVIIPTLNESATILSLLEYIQSMDATLEMIVSDAGSLDETAGLASRRATVVSAPRGRGVQMNVGAKVSSGEVLWFLHADTRPHPDSVIAIRHCLENPKVVGGGFRYCLDHPGFHFRAAEILSNLKNRALGLLFGDMGIFVRRTVFDSMQGYKAIPLMEDMDFSRRLKQHGEIAILPQTIHTSARRWIDDGFVKHSVRSWILQSAWALGVSPERLAKYYSFS